MTNTNIEPQTCIAQLDGFLGGIAAVDGKIRQLTAYAFTIRGGNSSPPEQIREFYIDQASFEFENAQKLEGGLKQLEAEAREL